MIRVDNCSFSCLAFSRRVDATPVLSRDVHTTQWELRAEKPDHASAVATPATTGRWWRGGVVVAHASTLPPPSLVAVEVVIFLSKCSVSSNCRCHWNVSLRRPVVQSRLFWNFFTFSLFDRPTSLDSKIKTTKLLHLSQAWYNQTHSCQCWITFNNFPEVYFDVMIIDIALQRRLRSSESVRTAH